MRRSLWLVAPLSLAACVDASQCGQAKPWAPCAGHAAQPGASGTPPTIVSLTTPSCAYVATPAVAGTLRVHDDDGDAQVAHVTVSQGARLADSDVQLDDAGRSGDDWSGPLTVALSGAMQPSSFDVRVKVTDRAGNQSAPVCNSLALLP